MNIEGLTANHEEILKGEDNSMRDYYITLGQSPSSKGVMFVLYSVLKKCTSAYVNPYTYLGQLSNNLNDAVTAARAKIAKFQIQVIDEETMQDRKQSDILGFGKYKDKTIEQIFDIDHGYVFWLSSAINNGTFKKKLNKKLTNALNEYHAISKELIVTENKAKSKPALPIDTELVERTLTCYKVVEPGEHDLFMLITQRFKDADGNIYQYKGTRQLAEKDETITLDCKVTANWESLGMTFNKINLR